MAKKSATGIGEMLGNLMKSPAFAETSARMDSILQTQYPQLSVAASSVIDPYPVLEVYDDESGQEDSSVQEKGSVSSHTLVSTDKPACKSAKTPIVPKGQSQGQSIGLTSERTDELIIYPSGNSSNNATNSLSGGQTDYAPNKLTVDISNERAIERINDLTNGLSYKQTTGRENGLAIEQPNEQVAERSQGQSSGLSNGRSARSTWAPLTENQGRILVYLFEVAGGLTNVDTVSADTTIAYGTVRKSIEVLIKEGYVLEKRRYNGHAFNGFHYSMNNHLCSLYISRVRGEQPQGQSMVLLNGHSIGRPDGLTIGRTSTPFSSKVLEKNLNLTTNPSFLDDPELGYWKEKGVNNRQVEKWAEEFVMEIGLVLQSLKYCRYEMIILNHEEEKNIENPVNWFYRVMQRTGLYPRPANYKSLLEIRAEALERSAKEISDARNRQAAAEKELAFQKLLSDPESAEYQALYDQVSSFAKEEGNETLVFALRDIFFQ